MTTDTLPLGVQLLTRALDEGFAAGRVDVADELCSPDLIEHQFGIEARGAAAIDGLKRCMADVHRLAPDIRYTLEDWAANDDIVWVRAVGRGTQTGPFFGPPSGTPFELTVIDVARIEGGRIAEHWGVPDRFALLAQTGRLEQLAAARFE
ncbi:MAG: ester cyclase [Pseudolysinimonas sp.]